MSNIPDISFIVPMYNVEQFLQRCVESLRNQTHENIEIILVDDESPDRCGELADKYARQDVRIKVIHQKNKWLGGARNAGLTIARGKYVCFVDSDDYVRTDMCEKLFAYIEKQQADMVIFDFYNVTQSGKIQSVSQAPIKPNTKFCGKEARDLLYSIVLRSHSINSACMKIYRRELLEAHHLYFDETVRYGEDYVFCLDLFPNIESFSYHHEPFYYYVENEKSIMHVYDPEMVNKFITLYEYRENFIRKENITTEENEKNSSELLILMIVKTLNRYLGNKHTTSKKQRVELIRKMCENKIIKRALAKIDVDDMDVGKYGKLMIYSMRHKKIHLINFLYTYIGRAG